MFVYFLVNCCSKKIFIGKYNSIFSSRSFVHDSFTKKQLVLERHCEDRVTGKTPGVGVLC